MRFVRKTNMPLWIIWHCTAVLAIVLVPVLLRLGKPVWALSESEISFLAGIALAYLASVLILTFRTSNGKTMLLRDLILLVLATFGIYFLYLLMTDSYVSRPILLSALIFSIISILLSFSLASSVQKLLIIVAATITLLSQLMADDINQLVSSLPEPYRSKKLIETEFYTVKATIYNNQIDGCPRSEKRCGTPKTPGGGLAVIGDGYLLATGHGDLYSLTLNSGNTQMETRLLPYRIPLNTDAFRKDNGDADLWVYRVTDILIQNKDNSFRLFAAHHHWKSDQQCSVLRISSLEGNSKIFLAGDAAAKWKTVYETKPCLPITKGRKGDGFKGADSGGRMVLLDNGLLLFSVGDYQNDGWNREPVFAQDDAVDYGKTILIDPDTGENSLYSKGHRNPQGLYVSPDRTIWLTEHGPRGGDELNMVLKGANYGWPQVTYGTEYGDKIWPLSSSQSQHDGYQRPIFSWIPSIAVSNVIGVESDLFPLWNGDLLVASYKQSMWRLRIREGRVIYAEPIMVLQRNGRIRDLMEDRSGRIMLWFDGGSIAILETVNTDIASGDLSGEMLFVQCTSCHNVNSKKTLRSDAPTALGPDLAGVTGRSIAGLSEYNYSTGLRELSDTWSEENLDDFLQNPQDFAPGNKMEFAGIEDANDRKKLIRYLSTLK